MPWPLSVSDRLRTVMKASALRARKGSGRIRVFPRNAAPYVAPHNLVCNATGTNMESWASNDIHSYMVPTTNVLLLGR
jgi:hypothetical protein